MDCRDLLKRLEPTPLLILAILIWTSSLLWSQTPDSLTQLDALVQQKQYIALEHAVVTASDKLPSLSRAYFQGVMANRVNHVEKSIRLLEPLIANLLETSPVRAEFALCTLADDYAKSFRYRNAARLYAEANRVAEQQGKQSECGAAKEASRWSLLRDAPSETVANTGPFTVKGERDTLGLFQVPVAAGNYSGSWMVDSGANLSVVSRSVANELGLATSTGSETAQGIAGLFVSVHTAVIPEIRLGPAVLRNVAVLVVEDSELSFSELGYRIEGCLGIPVLAALGKVTFYHDGRIYFDPGKIPAKEKAFHNFFFDRFTPLIVADFGHREQLFTIDTGAMGTMLSANFYKADGESFDSRESVDLELSGAGGMLAVPAYQVPSLVVRFGGSCGRIKDVSVLLETVHRPDEFYGDIGETALSSFSSFTLDFHAMHFSVNGGDPGDCTDNVTRVPSEAMTIY
jgi:predicted aspartyl protease